MSSEPVEITAYNYIWDTITMNGKPSKIYHLTKITKDKLDGAASRDEVNKLSHEIGVLRWYLNQSIIDRLKKDILKLLSDGRRHTHKFISNYPTYSKELTSEVLEAISQLETERKITYEKGCYKLADSPPADR
jgi:hypothetical protein